MGGVKGSLEQELELIQAEFDFLFSAWGFTIVKQTNYRDDHCSVWLESPTVPTKILFGGELAHVWGAPLNEELRFWRPAQKVLARIGQRINLGPLQGIAYREQVPESLHILARAIEPVFGQILDLMEKEEPA